MRGLSPCNTGMSTEMALSAERKAEGQAILREFGSDPAVKRLLQTAADLTASPTSKEGDAVQARSELGFNDDGEVEIRVTIVGPAMRIAMALTPAAQ